MSTAEWTPAETAIREFPFWNYGMDDVEPCDEAAEWVPDLATKIERAVRDQVAVEITAAAEASENGAPWGYGMDRAVEIARGGR